MASIPCSTKFRLLECRKCGYGFDARCHDTCPECLQDTGARPGARLVEEFEGRCGAERHECVKDSVAELGLSLQEQFGTRMPKPVETCLTCGRSVWSDARRADAIENGFKEVEALLCDESHFLAEVVDGFAGVRCRNDHRVVAVDVGCELPAAPISVEWSNEFLCSGGFNQYAEAVVTFDLLSVSRPVFGMRRLTYSVDVAQ